jgi:hypothetical protein
LTPLTRTSIIKAALENCCRRPTIIHQLRQLVLRSRDITYVGSLFAQFCLLERLAAHQPCPPLDQQFCYNLFGVVCGQVSKVPAWIKASFRRFKTSWPPVMRPTNLAFAGYMSILSISANEYATNCVNHVRTNFERRTIDYFFVRFSDESDDWFLEGTTVHNRRILARYAYNRASRNDAATGPRDASFAALKTRVERIAQQVNLGPTPVTDEVLSTTPHLYIPWLHTVLSRLEQRTSTREPTPQNFVSKGFVHRNIPEVRIPEIPSNKIAHF